MFFKNIIFYRMEAVSNLEAFFGALLQHPDERGNVRRAA